MEDKWSEIEVSENKEDNKVEFEVEEKVGKVFEIKLRKRKG